MEPLKTGGGGGDRVQLNDDFSEPPRRADSKNRIFIFLPKLESGPLRGPGVSLGRILAGGASIKPLWGGGGRALARGLYRPPPPELKARPPLHTPSPQPLCLGGVGVRAPGATVTGPQEHRPDILWGGHAGPVETQRRRRGRQPKPCFGPCPGPCRTEVGGGGGGQGLPL